MDKENSSQDVTQEITAENNETIKQFLGNQPPEEKPVEPSTIEDTKEKEETPPSEEKPSTEAPGEPEGTPEVPLEEVAEEIKAQTREEVKADILKTLGMTKEEKKEVEDSGFKFSWEQRGEQAPKDWKEQAEETLRLWEWKKSQQEEQLKMQQRESLAQEQARVATVNAEWDAQLDYLREEGLIPQIDPKIVQKIKEGKVLTAAERNDVGLKAQVGIFEAMYEVARQREEGGLQPIGDIIHIYNRYYKPKQPAGKKAPVSGGSISVSGKEEDLSYEDLHKRGFEDIIRS